MQVGIPSATAEMVCYWRALEATLPPEQRILNDPFARGFLGSVRSRLVDGTAALPAPARRALLRRLDQALQGAVTFVLARHRAIDDLILTTPSDQIVFLGAGYDTRPARLCERLCQSLVFPLSADPTKSAGLTPGEELGTRVSRSAFNTEELPRRGLAARSEAEKTAQRSLSTAMGDFGRERERDTGRARISAAIYFKATSIARERSSRPSCGVGEGAEIRKTFG